MVLKTLVLVSGNWYSLHNSEWLQPTLLILFNLFCSINKPLLIVAYMKIILYKGLGGSKYVHRMSTTSMWPIGVPTKYEKTCARTNWGASALLLLPIERSRGLTWAYHEQNAAYSEKVRYSTGRVETLRELTSSRTHSIWKDLCAHQLRCFSAALAFNRAI